MDQIIVEERVTISAEEYIRTHPGERVSFKRKKFRCKYCGQYIALACGEQRQYFKHSSSEQDKECEERDRRNAASKASAPEPSQHKMNLRMRQTPSINYYELGVPSLPSGIFDEVLHCLLTITPDGRAGKNFWLSDWLLEGETTWLNVGTAPSDFYSLRLNPPCDAAIDKWGERIKAVLVESKDAEAPRNVFETADDLAAYLDGLSDKEISEPKVTLTDIDGNALEGEIFYELPKFLCLYIRAEFDGRVERVKKFSVENTIEIKADKLQPLYSIDFGEELKIFQGFDCVRVIRFERSRRDISSADEKLFAMLSRAGGRPIKVSHALGNVVDRLKDYPKVRGWLYRCVRSGVMSEGAYKLLRGFLLNERRV